MYLNRYRLKFSASRGLNAPSRCSNQKPRERMACSHPLCRSVSPSTLRYSALVARVNVSIHAATLYTLVCHPKRFLPSRPARNVSLVDPKPQSHASRLSSLPFRIHQIEKPLFSPSFENVSSALPCVRRGLTLGFGYPLDELL